MVKLYFIAIFLIGVLPGSSVYGYSVKYGIAFLLVCIIANVAVGGASIGTVKLSRLIVYPACFLFCYALVALYNGVDAGSIVSHGASIGGVVLICLCAFLHFDNRYRAAAVSAILAISVFNSLVKISVWSLVFLGDITIWDFHEYVERVFDFKFIALESEIGARIHFPIDYLLPVAWYFSAPSRFDIGGSSIIRILRYALVTVIGLAIIISYSRLLWVYSLVSLFIFYRWRVRAAIVMIMSLVMMVPLFSLLFMDRITSVFMILRERFFGQHAATSDSIRSRMFSELYHFFSEQPVFGGGLGSHPNYIRFEHLPWNYELQTLSLLGQFGVVGFCLFVVYFFYYLGFFESNKLKVRIGMILGVWLAINSINCFMLTSQGGVIMLAFGLVIYDMKLRASVRRYSV